MGYRDGLIPPEYPEPVLTPDQHLSLLDAIGDLIVDEKVRGKICPNLTQYQIDSIILITGIIRFVRKSTAVITTRKRRSTGFR